MHTLCFLASCILNMASDVNAWTFASDQDDEDDRYSGPGQADAYAVSWRGVGSPRVPGASRVDGFEAIAENAASRHRHLSEVARPPSRTHASTGAQTLISSRHIVAVGVRTRLQAVRSVMENLAASIVQDCWRRGLGQRRARRAAAAAKEQAAKVQAHLVQGCAQPLGQPKPQQQQQGGEPENEPPAELNAHDAREGDADELGDSGQPALTSVALLRGPCVNTGEGLENQPALTSAALPSESCVNTGGEVEMPPALTSAALTREPCVNTGEEEEQPLGRLSNAGNTGEQNFKGKTGDEPQGAPRNLLGDETRGGRPALTSGAQLCTPCVNTGAGPALPPALTSDALPSKPCVHTGEEKGSPPTRAPAARPREPGLQTCKKGKARGAAASSEASRTLETASGSSEKFKGKANDEMRDKEWDFLHGETRRGQPALTSAAQPCMPCVNTGASPTVPPALTSDALPSKPCVNTGEESPPALTSAAPLREPCVNTGEEEEQPLGRLSNAGNTGEQNFKGKTGDEPQGAPRNLLGDETRGGRPALTSGAQLCTPCVNTGAGPALPPALTSDALPSKPCVHTGEEKGSPPTRAPAARPREPGLQTCKKGKARGAAASSEASRTLETASGSSEKFKGKANDEMRDKEWDFLHGETRRGQPALTSAAQPCMPCVNTGASPTVPPALTSDALPSKPCVNTGEESPPALTSAAPLREPCVNTGEEDKEEEEEQSLPALTSASQLRRPCVYTGEQKKQESAAATTFDDLGRPPVDDVDAPLSTVPTKKAAKRHMTRQQRKRWKDGAAGESSAAAGTPGEPLSASQNLVVEPSAKLKPERRADIALPSDLSRIPAPLVAELKEAQREVIRANVALARTHQARAQAAASHAIEMSRRAQALDVAATRVARIMEDEIDPG